MLIDCLLMNCIQSERVSEEKNTLISHCFHGSDQIEHTMTLFIRTVHVKKEKGNNSPVRECIQEYINEYRVAHSHFNHNMAFNTCFDSLPDLVLIELFSYLSSNDILWGFTGLNHRLTMLITERGYLFHINLSPARSNQFNTILGFLPLNDIQSLAIDNDASPLQLCHWPYLPRLRTLRIIGVYNHDELLLFLLLHAATLTHLIIRSNERLVPVSISHFSQSI